MFGTKSWLKRNYKERLFKINVSYLIKKLDLIDKEKVEKPNDWQEKKVQEVLKNIKKHKRIPIRIVLHEKKEQFRVSDGISRIIAFKRL